MSLFVDSISKRFGQVLAVDGVSFSVEPGRIAPWEWALAAVLMVVFLAGALWIAARLYSAGVLLYGQRIGFRAVWRATRVHR